MRPLYRETRLDIGPYPSSQMAAGAAAVEGVDQDDRHQGNKILLFPLLIQKMNHDASCQRFPRPDIGSPSFLLLGLLLVSQTGGYKESSETLTQMLLSIRVNAAVEEEVVHRSLCLTSVHRLTLPLSCCFHFPFRFISSPSIHDFSREREDYRVVVCSSPAFALSQSHWSSPCS